MKGGTRIAMGVAVGYLMGRTKKMRLALMITGAGLTGSLAKSPGGVMRRAAGALGASESVENLVGNVRGELRSAVTKAATTAATRRIDALSDRLLSAGGDAGKGEPGQRDEEDQRDEEEQEPGQERRQRGEGRDERRADESEAPRGERGRQRRDRGADDRDRDDRGGDDDRADGADGGGDESEPYRPVTRRRRPESTERGTSAAKKRAEGPSTARRTSRTGTAAAGSAERRTRR